MDLKRFEKNVEGGSVLGGGGHSRSCQAVCPELRCLSQPAVTAVSRDLDAVFEPGLGSGSSPGNGTPSRRLAPVPDIPFKPTETERTPWKNQWVLCEA